jgi:hypothetical protein
LPLVTNREANIGVEARGLIAELVLEKEAKTAVDSSGAENLWSRAGRHHTMGT